MEELTWQTVLATIDTAIADLAAMMESDLAHSTLYQQRMAVMMARRQYVKFRAEEPEHE